MYKRQHQVRGPLTSIRLRLELLEDQLSDAAHAAARQEVRGVLREVERLSTVLEQVLAWGSGGHAAVSAAESVDALGVAAARVDAWSVPAAARGVRLCLDGVTATGRQVPGALEQTLDVLLDNAVSLTPAGGEVLVTVHATAREVRAEVRDQGPGMTADEIARACEPFWRGSAGHGRRGTGLGLTIAAALLASSGGRLELGRADGGGLRAVAVLPRAG